MQTKALTEMLRKADYEVGIFAFYGIQGAKVDLANGIPIYPNDEKGYGVGLVKTYFDDFQADICISLVDIWVLKDMPRVPWYPWTPIDHEPCPPGVSQVLNYGAITEPIAMSEFGAKEIEKVTNKKPRYIPHGINTSLFNPRPKQRKEIREGVGWTDKFVIGTVATNHSRKNWNASFNAIEKLCEKHDNIIWYMHTKPFDDFGGDLVMARHLFGLDKVCCFPKQVDVKLGITQDELARAYNAMDVFLLPSMGEGFGIPALEAQSCGVPVIMANNTAQTELFSGGGWQLSKGWKKFELQSSFYYDSNPEEIYQYLEEAYSEWEKGTLQKRGEIGRQFALPYNEQTVFDKYWIPFLKDVEKSLAEKKARPDNEIEEEMDAAVSELSKV